MEMIFIGWIRKTRNSRVSVWNNIMTVNSRKDRQIWYFLIVDQGQEVLFIPKDFSTSTGIELGEYYSIPKSRLLVWISIYMNSYPRKGKMISVHSCTLYEREEREEKSKFRNFIQYLIQKWESTSWGRIQLVVPFLVLKFQFLCMCLFITVW